MSGMGSSFSSSSDFPRLEVERVIGLLADGIEIRTETCNMSIFGLEGFSRSAAGGSTIG